jgi:hypothetical protein
MPPELAPCLEPGEQILWYGRPRPYVFLMRGLPHIAYGITWSVLGAYWFYAANIAFHFGWWRVVPMLSLPFILAGFSFWFLPLRLGPQARRTWYVVTNRRVFIAQLYLGKKTDLRVFTREEMGPPLAVKRFDGLFDLILTRRAQDKPYLPATLDSGFFGLDDAPKAADAIKQSLS